MKKCPFCAEEIQDEAIYCRFCSQFLDGKKKVSFYLRPGAIVTAVLCTGPLAIPLFWLQPNWSRLKKIVLTSVLLFLSLGYIIVVMKMIQFIFNSYRSLYEI